MEPVAVPVELGIQVLDPNEPAGQAKEPGEDARRRAVGDADAEPKPRRSDDDGGGSGLALVIPGVAGLVIGAVGGFAAMRRRRA